MFDHLYDPAFHSHQPDDLNWSLSAVHPALQAYSHEKFWHGYVRHLSLLSLHAPKDVFSQAYRISELLVSSSSNDKVVFWVSFVFLVYLVCYWDTSLCSCHTSLFAYKHWAIDFKSDSMQKLILKTIGGWMFYPNFQMLIRDSMQMCCESNWLL